MKRFLALFMAVVTLCACAATLSSCSDDADGTQSSEPEATTPAPAKKLAYTVNEDNTTCTVTGLGSYDSTDVVIPDEIDGYKVTGIATKAFFDCSNLTSITIKDNVTSIGTDAFYGCSSLTSIHINSLEAWLNISFEDYWSNPCYPGGQLYLNGEPVSSVTIPDNITSIGHYAFAGYVHLKSIVIPDSVTIIGNNAFYRCEGLTSVTTGNGVTSIGRGTFSGCTSLTSITLSKNLTVIGANAFSSCTALTSITIPGTVESIGNFAFRQCTSLTTIKFTGTVYKWMEVSKGTGWNTSVPATEIVCSHGTVILN